MATANLSRGVSAAGDIHIDEVTLITVDGKEIDISLYVSELNIFEDMFRPGLAGNILIIDNSNLSQRFALIGDEYLRLKFWTPTMEGSKIHKTFKVYSITDKIMTNDTARQSYIMHFCSPEIIVDSLSPVYKTFEGKINKVVGDIFANYVATSRNGNDDFTPLVILGETDNSVKFTSPGWRPFKCINWLASKSICSGYNNPGYVFFESNKSYYYVNVEQLFKEYQESGVVAQSYVYAPLALADAETDDRHYASNVERQYRTVSDFKIVENFNVLKNTMNGYLANRLYTLDVVSKKYEIFDYDHVEQWATFYHMERSGVPPFSSQGLGSTRSPAGFNQIALQHQNLYTGFVDNVHDKVGEYLPLRTSTMAELTNLKIEITVPGRTDMEVGSMVKFTYPIASPMDVSDKNKPNVDHIYTGVYLVTAIRHKIDLQRHTMVLELTKDSFDGSAIQ